MRVFGSWELASKSFADSPLLGTGLGGENLRRVHDEHKDELKYIYPFIELGIGQILAEILRSTGLLGLLVMTAIYVMLLCRIRWAITGGSLILVGFFWGDPFSTALWPFFIASAAMMPSKELRWSKWAQLLMKRN